MSARRLPVLQPVHALTEDGRFLRSRPRARTITVRVIARDEKRRSPAERRETAQVLALHPRPAKRADCVGRELRCPWVGCRYHLYLDVNPVNGSIKVNFPDVEPGEMPVSCALVIAEMVRAEGELLTPEATGMAGNMTRERVRQIEVKAVRRLRRLQELREVLSDLDG